MKNLLKIIFIVFLISVTVFAQDKDKSNPVPKDSLLHHLGINPRINIGYDFNDFYLPFRMNLLQSKILYNNDPATVWLRTEIALNYSMIEHPASMNASNDLTMPLYRQYLKNSKFSPINYILGMAQAAAAGYLAYRHIKKYGFWK